MHASRQQISGIFFGFFMNRLTFDELNQVPVRISKYFALVSPSIRLLFIWFPAVYAQQIIWMFCLIRFSEIWTRPDVDFFSRMQLNCSSPLFLIICVITYHRVKFDFSFFCVFLCFFLHYQSLFLLVLHWTWFKKIEIVVLLLMLSNAHICVCVLM